MGVLDSALLSLSAVCRARNADRAFCVCPRPGSRCQQFPSTLLPLLAVVVLVPSCAASLRHETRTISLALSVSSTVRGKVKVGVSSEWCSPRWREAVGGRCGWQASGGRSGLCYGLCLVPSLRVLRDQGRDRQQCQREGKERATARQTTGDCGESSSGRLANGVLPNPCESFVSASAPTRARV